MPAIASSSALKRFRILDLSRVRAGPSCVRQFSDFGADVAYPIGELESKLPGLLENLDTLCYELGHERSNDDVVLSAIDNVRRRARRGIAHPRAIVDPSSALRSE